MQMLVQNKKDKGLNLGISELFKGKYKIRIMEPINKI